MRSEEKPSNKPQWQEKSDIPMATRPMSKQEIEEHRVNLVASYKCKDTDIYYKFQKITNDEDDDKDECLWLKYYLKCVMDGVATDREIFKIKLPIPDELKRMADQIKKQMNQPPPATAVRPTRGRTRGRGGRK